MVVMKATQHTHHHSKLIADILAPEGTGAINRRGHAMREDTPSDTHESTNHICYEHNHVHTKVPTRPPKPLSLARVSAWPTALYRLKSLLPAWAPRKFTLQDGVTTDWQAAMPSNQTLANTGVLMGFLVIAAFAVWALPSSNAPQVIAEKPVVGSSKKASAPQPQGTLVAAPATAGTPTQSTGMQLYFGRRTTSKVIPTLIAQSSPANSVTAPTGTPATQTNTTPSSSGTPTTPISTPPPASGGETTTPPVTEPITPPADTPVVPPTEPVNPPIVIIDPTTEVLDELLGTVTP